MYHPFPSWNPTISQVVNEDSGCALFYGMQPGLLEHGNTHKELFPLPRKTELNVEPKK